MDMQSLTIGLAGKIEFLIQFTDFKLYVQYCPLRPKSPI